jgi:O-antigen biosynthesis protein
VVALSSRTSTERAVVPADAWPWQVGTGGNFSVTRSAYLEVGGNDERLGTGSPGRAGNDLDLFRRLLQHGAEARYEPDLLVLHERATTAEYRARRWTYGFGVGACVALWRRQGDPASWRVLRAWAALRLQVLRSRRRPAAAVDEARILLGTLHGLVYGWRAGR